MCGDHMDPLVQELPGFLGNMVLAHGKEGLYLHSEFLYVYWDNR